MSKQETNNKQEIDLDFSKLTPMMAQWHACKKVAGDALLFFRLGDFYEAFFEDALLASKELELTLTKRQDTPMCGVPAHASESYIDKLVSKGFKVAIAEQTEDPKKVKGLVKREVVRVVTPGTIMHSSLLKEQENNYFASICQIGKLFGLSFLDITTGQFRVLEVEENQLLNELYLFKPAEILISLKFFEKARPLIEKLERMWRCLITKQENWKFELQFTSQVLLSHFQVYTLEGFGLKGMTAGLCAAGALLNHIKVTLSLPVNHIHTIELENNSQFMSLDANTQRHLELTESLKDQTKKGTLLEILDQTLTPMGGRLLKNWIKQPLLSPIAIKKRQDFIETFYLSSHTSQMVCSLLEQVKDLERLSMKISSSFSSPKDLRALATSLAPLPEIRQLLLEIPLPLAQELADQIEPLPEVVFKIKNTLVEEPPFRLGEGVVFKKGVCQELDELREIRQDIKAWLIRYQNQLKETLFIKTLKVGYNKMFGYFIEVSKGQTDKIPETFQRRQTLVNAERYISPELKDFEYKILHAEEKISALEEALFLRLKEEVSQFSKSIQKTSKAIASLDCALSLAKVAKEKNYVKPHVDDSLILNIESGRHPVIEAIYTKEPFIPNDTFLGEDGERLILLTGPNMAGKSTYIRQTALITLMAHIGSFVPAKKAHLGIVDKIFTRIGASDDLASGQSTFMVEMAETANILNNITHRSLVVLDEIGRGTSTYDGISIAWAVAEYLLTVENKSPKTLFATHYFELTRLQQLVKGAVNYHVAVQENNEQIIFLRKIIRGGADKSWGIHVAKLAGLPLAVIERAGEILNGLEKTPSSQQYLPIKGGKRPPSKQKLPTFEDLQMTLF